MAKVCSPKTDQSLQCQPIVGNVVIAVAAAATADVIVYAVAV